jgi:hypothetical protein
MRQALAITGRRNPGWRRIEQRVRLAVLSDDVPMAPILKL